MTPCSLCRDALRVIFKTRRILEKKKAKADVHYCDLSILYLQIGDSPGERLRETDGGRRGWEIVKIL